MIEESYQVYLKLREASIKSQRRDFDVIQSEFCEPYIFSDDFNRKIEKLFRFSKKPYFKLVNTVGKRIAMIILTFITALTVTTFSVKAFREPFINFTISVYEKFTSIIFQADDIPDDFPIEIEETFFPEKLPDGYTLVETNNYRVMVKTIYSNGSDDIIFEQHILSPTHFTIDTEDVEIENLIIDDIEVLFYSNKGINNIIWADGLYGYTAFGTVGKNELLHLINLMKH